VVCIVVFVVEEELEEELEEEELEEFEGREFEEEPVVFLVGVVVSFLAGGGNHPSSEESSDEEEDPRANFGGMVTSLSIMIDRLILPRSRIVRGPVFRVCVMNIDHQFHFFIIFDDVVEYFSIRCTQLKKQGRRTKPVLTVG